MRNLIHALLAVIFFLVGGSANAQRITVTIAGTGVAGFSGDNATSATAKVNGPKDICMDATHNLYFVDHVNGRVRKISAAKGVITTVAGGGTSTADGVAATSALLDPATTSFMCMNAAGDIFICTSNKIRKISAASGTITTVAGTGVAGFTGDGGPAAAASINNPQGICIDATGNLYIVDRNNNRIRKIEAATGIITTIAGGGSLTGEGVSAASALLSSPACICITPAGSIFFSDNNNMFPAFYCDSKIKKIDPSGILTTVAGLSPGSATFNVPANMATIGTTTGLCCNDSGDVYCDEMSCSCRMLSHTNDTLYIVGGDFGIQSFSDDLTSPLSNMNNPLGLCADNAGNVFIADSGNQRIRKIIKLTNTPTFALGNGQSIDAISGAAYALDVTLKITDLDLSQTETWTAISSPVHGTLSGFPATMPSQGTSATTKPTGVFYTSASSYVGPDSFKVKVSDGMLTDIVTVYVWVGAHPSSVNTLTGNNAINMFPNPVSSVLNIEWANCPTCSNSAIAITDVAGHILYRSALNNTNGMMQIDVSDLAAGVYHATINGETGTFVKQ